MFRTVNHVEEDEYADSSSPTESKTVDRKGNALRSKHSETEQRRRSKINERFQMLRDLIPENNDQKRDKASFLLEVIDYVQFLQEKLQMYEGSCQGWSPEPTKLTPRRVNSGPIGSFVDQSHFDGHLSAHEENEHNSIESDFIGAALYEPNVNSSMTINQGLPLNMTLQPPVFEGVPCQSHQGSFPEAALLTHFVPQRSYVNDCSVPIHNANEEELKSVSAQAGISSAYSQRLLNSLTSALQSCGVDLSQTNISVRLDIGRQTNIRSADTMFNLKDHDDASVLNALAPENIVEDYEQHPSKRFKNGQT